MSNIGIQTNISNCSVGVQINEAINKRLDEYDAKINEADDSNYIDPRYYEIDIIKENKLIVVESLVDMSTNFCITATKEWVYKNCPELLSTYKEFIRYSETDDIPYGRFGCPFLEYDENNIGYHYAEEVESNGYYKYAIDYKED